MANRFFSKRKLKLTFSTLLGMLMLLFFVNGHGYSNNPQKEGKLVINVQAGEEWEHSFRVMWIIKVTNQPQMAFWLEDTSGNHMATMFVTHRTATQDWRAGPFEDKEKIERKSALPFWAHQHQNQGIMAETTCNSCHDLHETEEKKVASGSKLAAVTGATPEQSFSRDWLIPVDLKTGTFIVKAEINHSKDFNDHYQKDVEESDPLYSGGKMGSGQPSVIWQGKIELGGEEQLVKLKKVGHGHPSGKDGEVYPDFQKMDSALKVVDSISVKYVP